MNRFAYILLAVLILCGQPALYAQTYDQVLRRNFWNGSRNISGIRQDNVSQSYAEVTAGYEDGGYKPTWQAEKAWSAGAATASVRHLDDISFKGGFSFSQWEGYGMCGSMFIDPGYYPVDVLEFTPGRKTLQTYALDGGFSYDVAPQWRVGVMVDFASANMAKRKDLRHTNWKLDLVVAPGVMYYAGDLALGLTYIYGKSGETIDAEQVGTAESSYYAFFDKGLMYGVYQVWTGSGVHLDVDGVKGFPVKEFSNGFAVQVQYRGLFAEVEYAHTRGVVGEKDYIWYRFPGNQVNASLGYRKTQGAQEHIARLYFGWKSQNMYESVLEKVTENGVTNVLTHGANMMQHREEISVRPSYELVHRALEFRLGAEVGIRNGLASQMYPYIYTQSLVHASGYYGMLFRIGHLDLGVTGTYGRGWVSESGRTVSDDSGVQTQPFRLQEWYDRQIEYETARRFDAEVMVRYNFQKGIYLRLDACSVKAYKLPSFDDPTRLTMQLAAGLKF